jgi:S1-C subfamily serine protease
MSLGMSVWIVKYDSFNGGLAALESSISQIRSFINANESSSQLLESSDVIDRAIRIDRVLDNTWDGAGVISSDGKLIGTIITQQGSLSLVIPGYAIQSAVTTFAHTNAIDRPKLGIAYYDLSIANDQSRAQRKGLLLAHSDDGKTPAVQNSSAAFRAGVREGDILIGVDQLQLSDLQGLPEILSLYHPGERITIHLERNETIKDIPITLERRSSAKGKVTL